MMNKHPVPLLLAAGIAWSILAGCTSTNDGATASPPETSRAEDALASQVTYVPGDTPCPSGYTLAYPEEARANQVAICAKLDTWDVARLSGGGVMDGPGHSCGIRYDEDGPVQHSVCKKVDGFVDAFGDDACPSGLTVASPSIARASQRAVCSVMDTWDVARLAGGAVMDGPGHGCRIRDEDSHDDVANTICAELSFVKVSGDLPCAPGATLLTPDEARASQHTLCAKLGTWDVIRLAGGGVMEGPGYGCEIRDWDTRSTSAAFCKS